MKFSFGVVAVLVLFILLFGFSRAEVSSETTTYYATKHGTTFAVTTKKPDDTSSIVATMAYISALNTTGWDILNLKTTSLFSDSDQAYAAGFVEGYATYEGSWYNWLNLFGEFPNGTIKPHPIDPKIATFLTENDKWMAGMIKVNAAKSDLWYQIGLEMKQFDGFLDGCNAVAPSDPKYRFTRVMMLALVGVGDFMDLMTALNVSFVDWTKKSKREIEDWFILRSRCSALVKVAADYSDIFFSHATWAMFNNMLRIYKHYTLNFNGRGAKSRQISFSSYPASLSSVDDFYVTDTGLAIAETTLSAMNSSVFDGKVTPQSLPYWVRVMVASRMATTGEEWVNIFKMHNSGTYNNQWFVFDMKKFTPWKPMPSGTFWVAEQMPGYVFAEDKTYTLQYGYWPSYNIPSDPKVFEAMGFASAVKRIGRESFDYQTGVRGEIFRKRQATVNDMASFQNLMQYNQYKTDPLSEGNPVYAIASRGDLRNDSQGGASCFGEVDVKATSWSLFQKGRQVWIFGGPTPQQPPFDFTHTNATGYGCNPRHGIPDRWPFGWQLVSP